MEYLLHSRKQKLIDFYLLLFTYLFINFFQTIKISMNTLHCYNVEFITNYSMKIT